VRVWRALGVGRFGEVGTRAPNLLGWTPYRHRDFYMGHVPPTYSPKYNDVVRVYGLSDPSLVAPTPNVVTASAAKTLGPWDKVLQSIYLLPMASCRSNSTSSLEHGGVTDMWDSGIVVGVTTSMVDSDNILSTNL